MVRIKDRINVRMPILAEVSVVQVGLCWIPVQRTEDAPCTSGRGVSTGVWSGYHVAIGVERGGTRTMGQTTRINQGIRIPLLRI